MKAMLVTVNICSTCNQVDLFQGSSILGNKLSKYYCEAGRWSIVKISYGYNSLELSFSSMIIFKPLSKWWSSTANYYFLVFVWYLFNTFLGWHL